MPRLVLIAKSTYVWLDQLSRRYGRDIRTLDAIPDEELDRLARLGITGLWLIGLWERSHASPADQAVWRGNPDAAASAYSLDDYRDRATTWAARPPGRTCATGPGQRGIRLASDMVPNHMGIDSRWVIEHPDWFVSLPEPPYPAYPFSGANLAERRAGRDPPRGPLLGQHATPPWCSSARPLDAASAATSTTATTARASPGTTPRSSTSARRPSARR